ncbi:hypothetical protein K4039_21325 [Lyngbya sp. CCAP 1446/10]|nr:hypothetical protein [Lyngbya sp. CCAP 1446/10]MCW6052544.1 hypothetical protein [Lyngbya sp. CCAP 1446/10]
MAAWGGVRGGVSILATFLYGCPGLFILKGRSPFWSKSAIEHQTISL